MAEREITVGHGENNCESEKRIKRGIATLIVNLHTGHLLVVEEQKVKDETGRTCGQLSVPLETRKKDEGWYGNMLGSLAEAFDDTDRTGRDIREQLHDSLFVVDNVSLETEVVSVPHKDRLVVPDVAVLIFDGDDIAVDPHNADEVAGFGWVHPDAFENDPLVRPLARDLVTATYASGHVERVVETYLQQSPNDRRHALPRGFSVKEMYDVRESLTDM